MLSCGESRVEHCGSESCSVAVVRAVALVSRPAVQHTSALVGATGTGDSASCTPAISRRGFRKPILRCKRLCAI